MTIFYIDPINGSDANNGTSWATAWQSVTTGATSARIAPGDIIRIAKSPDPVNTGLTASWGDAVTPLRSSNTASANISATTDTQINWLNHGLSTGDLVTYSSSTINNINTSGMYSITVVNANAFTLDGGRSIATTTNSPMGTGRVASAYGRAFKLTSVPYQVIDNCDFTWSAGTNATVTRVTTSPQQGTGVLNVAVNASPPANTKLAYRDLGSTGLNLSSYQQLTFWIKSTLASASGLFNLNLCSDQLGATVVNSFQVPAIATANVWTPVTVDLGSAMGSTIKSIALYTSTTPGTAAVTINLDNLVAAKAPSAVDCITHNHLIGTNSSANIWYTVRSLEMAGVLVDGSDFDLVNNVAPCISETAGSGSLFTRVPFFSDTAQTTQRSGAAGSPILYSGGWNTSTTVQDGETFFDGQTYRLQGLVCTNFSYNDFERLNFSRYGTGVIFSTSRQCNVSIKNIANCNFGLQATSSAISNFNIKNITCCNKGLQPGSVSSMFYVENLSGNVQGMDTSAQYQNTYRIDRFYSNNSGLSLGQFDNTFIMPDVQNIGWVSAKAVIGSKYVNVGDQYFRNCNFGNLALLPAAASIASNARWAAINSTVGGVYYPAYTYTDGGIITQESNVGENGGYGFKLNLSATYRNSAYPLDLRVGRVAVEAGKLATITLRVNNEAANMSANMKIIGGLYAPAPSDVVSNTVTTATGWQTLGMTFTPSATGVVELTFLCWSTGGTGNVFIDNLEVKQ